MIWRTPIAYAALAACLALAGCATPGPPQPPSLHLPGRVADLAAIRSGNTVALTWTMPKRDTDHLPLTRPVDVRICRSEPSAPCAPIANITAQAGAPAHFSESLPDPLASGEPRPLRYLVELRNRSGRSAGMSNPAILLAGQAPPPVAGLSAEVRRSGIALHWEAASPAVSIRLRRTLATPSAPQPAGAAHRDVFAPSPEPVEQSLLVPADSGRALDRAITLGQTYTYTAQRVARLTVDGQQFELASPVSPAIRVEALDTFPPSVPMGLVAVATIPETGSPASAFIDLNWQPAPEADTAGYIVYRRQANASDSSWQRVSGPHPVPAPAYHDPSVQPGRTYQYAVTSIDRLGHESARSQPAEESVPQP